MDLLGWPFSEKKTALPDAQSVLLSEQEDYTIYRMSFEVLKGLKFSGLFFKQKGDDKKPLVIVQHGGLGTPEAASGLYGDTSNYNDMTERVLNRGVHVFAPQLLLWADDYGVPFNRVELDAKLKRVGSSITAIEIWAITRVLDYFEQQDCVKNFGMVGMSYGGFYTLFTAATDTRIKAALSSSFFNSRDAVCWADWSLFQAAERFDDAEVACLVYPRKLWITVADRDELFDAKNGTASFEQIKEYAKEVGTEWISFTVFDGTHEFIKEDTPIKALVEELQK